MAYKLAVAAVLVASVAFTLNDQDGAKNFKFNLHFDRLPADEWDKRIRNADGKVDQVNIHQTLREITRGWDGQQLVLDEVTGAPAPFSPEARDVLYNVPGFGDIALQAYVNGVAARVKT
jgi:hypothetical protein